MGIRPGSPLLPLRTVNPRSLFKRLCKALGRPELGQLDPASIVSQPHPETVKGEGSVGLFRDAYLLKEVLRKYPKFDLGIDTRERALASFTGDERLNRQTNDRLSSTLPNHSDVHKVLDLAARKVVQISGRFSSDEFLARVRFGPGSTTSLPRHKAHNAWKLSSSPHSTSRAAPITELVLNALPVWKRVFDSYGCKVVIRETDRVECVPKNAKTDRTIGIGPDLNVLCQLGLGGCLRARLFQHGIDLSDQSINQRRAREGSVHGTTGTIDLKSASQSIVSMLVWRMFGNHSELNADLRWYNLLDALRVEFYELEGETRRYELFSAMGNGYTFEVESIIFYALATACCEILGIPADVSVYGDDIIAPVASIPFMKEVFEYCGLRFNDEKSFWTTDDNGHTFRESCGKHYLDGIDVTPFYIDSPLETVDDIVLAANNLVRWARMSYGRDGRVLPVYLWLISHLPTCVRRCRIPYGAENDGLISDFDEAAPHVAYQLVSGTPIGFRVQTLIGHSYPNFSWVPELAYVDALMSKSQKPFKPPRESTWVPRPLPVREEMEKSSLHIGRRVVMSWPLIGPWVSDSYVSSFTATDYDLGAALHASMAMRN